MKKVDYDYRASEIEEDVRNYWKEIDAYKKTKGRRAQAKPYSFIDGPPYTSGSIHVGTAWNKILKDLYLRYRRMNGYNVWDQPGFDMHGLPIEVRVEQSIGIKHKSEIETFGIENFIERCRKFALEYRDKQTEEFKLLGVWLDWQNPYQTIDRSFMSSVWWTISEVYKKGLITKAYRVLPWCPRCETALAESEIEYWDESDPSIYVRFALLESSNVSLIIWTTTPWTIPGNVAAAVHPDEEYAFVEVKTSRDRKETFIVMKCLVEEALPKMGFPEYKIVGTIVGKELLGKRYRHPLLEFVPKQRTFEGKFVHAVVTSDTVARENTGIVHIAPGHGPEDFEIGKEFALPVFCPVDEEGIFTEDAGERYAGKPVSEAAKFVLDDLQDLGLLVKEDTITHRYGHCWRCKTPIIYRTTEQWFLKIPAIKDEILRSNESVKWYPEWAGTGRQKDWIVNARDWCISRQRYWGTPLPFWLCSCGEIKVVSGIDDLKEADGFFEGIDLHRPWIDKLTFKCHKCGKVMTRVPDLLDVWIDSGACSWASFGYPMKKAEFEKWWPIEWITEGNDQTRGWFYSQLVLGTMVFGRSPFKSVMMHGYALDSQGRPMSKSEGNIADPIEIVRANGADSLRLYLIGAVAPWDDVSFQLDGPKEANRFLNILWNVYKFATLYMSIDAYDPKKDSLGNYLSVLKPEDRWVLSRLEKLKTEVASYLDNFTPHEAKRALEKFIADDVSRWYVRLIRDRMWIEGSSAEKYSAYAVLHRVLRDCVLMLAPFTPHVTEKIYQNLDGTYPTVHMADWPAIDASLRDESIESGMDLVREIVELVANARQTKDLNLRWPLKRIVIKADADDTIEKINLFKDILLEQVNAKALVTVPVGEEWEDLVLEVVPNPNAIGVVYRQWSSKIAVLLKSRPAKSIKEGVEKGEYKIGIEGQLVEITPNMVSFTTSLPPDVVQLEFSHGIVYVDFEMTDELEAEGFARETVRRIQQMRKDMKLDVEEFVDIEMLCSERLRRYLEAWLSYISKETRAKNIRFSSPPKGEYIVEWNVEDEVLSIGVTNLKMKQMIGELASIQGLSLEKSIRLYEAGFRNLASLSMASDAEVLSIGGIDREDLKKIREAVGSKAPRIPPQPMPTIPMPAAAPVQPEMNHERQIAEAPKVAPAEKPEGEMAAARKAEAPAEIQKSAASVVQPTVPPVPSLAPQPSLETARPIAEPPAHERGSKEIQAEASKLEKSSTYLVEEDKPETSYRLFLKLLEGGMKGCCVTRNYPAKIRTKFSLGDVPLYWLTNVGKEAAIRPKDLEKLAVTIEQHLSQNGAVILLDGLEYLITNNNFITVLRMIQSLRDQVTLHQSILIVAVNSSTLERHQLNLLEREFDGIIQG
ncbi:MAG: isoleucine--tRNA ligase [Thermoplasmata archaeon]